MATAFQYVVFTHSGFPGERHASVEAALGPPAVQSSGAPVPDGPGGPERELAGDQRGPDLQVRRGAPGLTSVSVFLPVPISKQFPCF